MRKATCIFTRQSRVELNPGSGDSGHFTDLLTLRHFSSILLFYGSLGILTHRGHSRCSFPKTIPCLLLDPEHTSKSVIQDLADAALAGVGQWIGWQPANQKVARARAWVEGQVPSWGCGRGNQLMFLTSMFLSLFLPSFPSL